MPPGKHIKEEMKARGWTTITLAEKMGVDPNVVMSILRGRTEITSDLAEELAKAFGTSKELWLNLEAERTELCCAKIPPDDVWCHRPAKYVYQPTSGDPRPLCGLHAKRFKGSRNLTKMAWKR